MVVFGLPPLVLSPLAALCVDSVLAAPHRVCRLRPPAPPRQATGRGADDAQGAGEGAALADLDGVGGSWGGAPARRTCRCSRRSSSSVLYFAAAGAPASSSSSSPASAAAPPRLAPVHRRRRRARAEPLHRAHLRRARAAHNALVRLASYPFDPRAWSLEPGSPDLLFGSFCGGGPAVSATTATMTGMSSETGKLCYTYSIIDIVSTV